MTHKLGIVGTEFWDIDKQIESYSHIILINDDILGWLNNHDLKIDDKGNKIFISNKIEYIYLGPYIEELEKENFIS